MFGIDSAAVRSRVRRLVRKFFSNPLLPILGWTEAVKVAVGGGPTLTWVGFAGVVTVVWVLGDELQRQAEEAVDEVAEAAGGTA